MCYFNNLYIKLCKFKNYIVKVNIMKVCKRFKQNPTSYIFSYTLAAIYKIILNDE